MTTVDLENGPAKAAPSRLTLRLAALVLAHQGTLPHAVAVASAEAVRSGRRPAQRMVDDGMRPLVHAGVVFRHEGTWYAPNLADLGAWLADGLEYRERAGHTDDPAVPVIPQPRGRAAA